MPNDKNHKLDDSLSSFFFSPFPSSSSCCCDLIFFELVFPSVFQRTQGQGRLQTRSPARSQIQGETKSTLHCKQQEAWRRWCTSRETSENSVNSDIRFNRKNLSHSRSSIRNTVQPASKAGERR
jgi:hypothetical protein